MVSDTIAILYDKIVDTTEVVANYYRTLRLAYLSTKQSLISQSLLIEKALDSLRETRLLVARNILNSISPNNAWERNDKYVWNVQLNRNSQAIVNGLKDTLTIIANQCWGYGGDAVFIARAKIDTFSYGFDTCTAPIIARETNTLDSKENFKIYPNPAGDKLFLETNIDSDGTFSLYNTNGFLITEIKFKIQSRAELDISNLASGMYYIKYKSDGLEPIIKKIIKQ
jgi:hypothetical protein